MVKNIILCSDGTGQKGGEGPATNVFRIYNMVDNDKEDQLVFYDDGIGTESHVNLVKASARAFGFGFGSNVINLYKHLVRHYRPGDKVFMFGYSRGAATVRALAGMIQTVGLLKRDCLEFADKDTGIIDELRFHITAIKAMYYYRGAQKNPEDARKFMRKYTHGVIDIEMIGVWDTVDSLGFPKESSWLVIGLSLLMDKIMEQFFPKRHYNYQLDKNVKHAYQALAVDETRYSFMPIMWNEVSEQRPENIEQVWFPGSHGNVGGGTDRTELSSISLNWMMNKAQRLGLRFYARKVEDVKEEVNDSGRLYNSRQGIKTYYRFGPRHIRNLSLNKGESILQDKIRIHESVFKRMRLTEYYPILPNEFEIYRDNSFLDYVYHEESEHVKKMKGKVNVYHKIKSWTYHVLVETSVAFFGLIWYTNVHYSDMVSGSVVYKSLVEVIPGFMHNFMYFSTHMYPWVGITFLLLFLGIYAVNKVNKILIDRTVKKINWELLKSIQNR
jgi:uncharacterized protein (DUF2235 family)